MTSTLILLLAVVAPSSSMPDGEWAKGIEYTTDWDKAIKTARASGKMIFIYNGWQREGI